jgi:hypothetical protein
MAASDAATRNKFTLEAFEVKPSAFTRTAGVDPAESARTKNKPPMTGHLSQWLRHATTVAGIRLRKKKDEGS